MKHVSHNSPASIAASIGKGSVAGAGELNPPGAGPGRAAQRKIGAAKLVNPTYKTPSGAAPKGMKIYREE